MIRIDPFFFYQVGAAIRPATAIEHQATRRALIEFIYGTETWLTSLLGQQVVTFRTCRPKGYELLEAVKAIVNVLKDTKTEEWDSPVDWYLTYRLRTVAQEFETLFSGEMQFADLYFVTKKGGFDTTELTENGIVIFPKDLPSKVPETIRDAKAAARCIAFELPTAAAFHLHRVNESVLRRYYDVVTGGKPHPERRTVEKYIDAMKGYQVGDKKVIGALATLNTLHRNPVAHPEQTLEDVDEAIALLGQVHTTVTHMLKEIKPAPLVLTSPESPSEAKAIESKASQDRAA